VLRDGSTVRVRPSTVEDVPRLRAFLAALSEESRWFRFFSAGVNLDAYLGRMAVCAEAVALGQAVTESGETGIETIVAVRHPEPADKDQTIVVVSPCGSCRELIWDYDRNARVIVPGANGPAIAAIGELLPNKYSRERTL